MGLPKEIAPGQHELRIEKLGYEPITRRVQYSGKRIEIEIADDELKKRSAGQ